MAAKDRISGLPGDIFDHILGFLPIRDAARTSALSAVWRDAQNLLHSPTALPMLKSLECANISSFNITAPKLRSLKALGRTIHGVLPVTLDLNPICSLHLCDCSAKDIIEELTRLGKHGSTLNVGCLKLHLWVEHDEIPSFINLLRMCPQLYKVDVQLSVPKSTDVVATTMDTVLEHPEFIVTETCKSVHMLNLSCAFRGSRPEMLLFKWLLSCFPMLEKVFIFQSKVFCSNTEFKNERKLLRFLRASSKAKIVYT